MIRLLLGTLVVAAAAFGQMPSAMKYDPQADPNAGLKAAIERAGQEHKRILMDVGGEWCGWCHRMDKFLADHAELQALLNKNYVVLKVNFSPENANKAFLAGYPKVAGYPHLFVLNGAGKLLVSKNTGDLEEGKSYNLERFREFLEKYAPAK
jgi:thioredoxin-related protein